MVFHSCLLIVSNAGLQAGSFAADTQLITSEFLLYLFPFVSQPCRNPFPVVTVTDATALTTAAGRQQDHDFLKLVIAFLGHEMLAEEETAQGSQTESLVCGAEPGLELSWVAAFAFQVLNYSYSGVSVLLVSVEVAGWFLHGVSSLHSCASSASCSFLVSPNFAP